MTMLRSLTASTVALTAAVAVTALAPSSAAGAVTDGSSADRMQLRAIGLTPNGRLISFHVADPSGATKIGKVSGLEVDTRLVGIDFRVQNGMLYGLGDHGGVYTLNRKTAEATRVSQVTALLEGQQFGVDFNPAADRLRIISDTGQNLRHDVNGFTNIDTPLSYPPEPEEATGVTMAAYTNNDLDA